MPSAILDGGPAAAVLAPREAELLRQDPMEAVAADASHRLEQPQSAEESR